MDPNTSPTLDDQVELLMRGVAEAIPEDGLRDLLQRAHNEKRSLRVKLGIDPTASDIHLGFAVVLRKLRQFQDLGHTACLIFCNLRSCTLTKTTCNRRIL